MGASIHEVMIYEALHAVCGTCTVSNVTLRSAFDHSSLEGLSMVSSTSIAC